MTRAVSALHCADHDRVILHALGLIFAGALIALTALLHVLPPKIGA